MKSRLDGQDLGELLGFGAAGTCRVPYDETPGACPRCGAVVTLHVGTDGDGHLTERAGPCLRCGRGVHVPFGLPFRRCVVMLRPKIAPSRRRTLREARAEIRAAILRGLRVTTVAAEVGVARGVVMTVRRALEAEGKTLTCRCGKAAFHRGRCRQAESNQRAG